MTATAPVSVIVPVRNGAAHLDAALASVLAQDPRPEEVLVIDGGSDDGSAAIAATSSSVDVVAQTGRGLSAARNEAIEATRSPIVAFCDADDRWTTGSLAVRLAALDPDTAPAVIGHVVFEAVDGSDPSEAQRTRLGRAAPGHTPGALLVCRDLFGAIGGFDESLTIGGDSDWFVRLHQLVGPPTVVDDIVLRKGARGSSLSGDIGTYRRELLSVAERFIERRRDDPKQS